MSLIAGIKGNNEGCIFFDFRLTRPATGEQYDRGIKYGFYDNRLAIFMAGATSLIENIIQSIDINGKDILHDDIDIEGAPFSKAVVQVFSGLDSHYNSQLICVHLNTTTESFKMFRCDIINQNGVWDCRITSDDEFQWEVIGTGDIIANETYFSQRIGFALDKTFIESRNRGYDLFQSALGIEAEIKTRLDILGPAVYRELGISPVINFAIIQGGHLGISERTVTGEYFEGGERKKWAYQFGVNPSGKPSITDVKTGENFELHDPNSSGTCDLQGESLRFDPESKEGDETKYAPYTLSQWVVRFPYEKPHIIRYVHKTVYFSVRGIRLPVRNMIYATEMEFDTLRKAEKIINDYPLNITKIDLDFEEELPNISLFEQAFFERFLDKEHPFIIVE